MRLIDADALIKKHPKVISLHMRPNLDLAPTIDVAPKWISVEERLPEEPGGVLITLCGCVTIALYHGYGKFETGSGVVWNAGLSVTHWMPLPSTEGLK